MESIQHQTIKVGDKKVISRTIEVIEIDHEKKQIKMKWADKFGKVREQWVTYNMYHMF